MLFITKSYFKILNHDFVKVNEWKLYLGIIENREDLLYNYKKI